MYVLENKTSSFQGYIYFLCKLLFGTPYRKETPRAESPETGGRCRVHTAHPRHQDVRQTLGWLPSCPPRLNPPAPGERRDRRCLTSARCADGPCGPWDSRDRLPVFTQSYGSVTAATGSPHSTTTRGEAQTTGPRRGAHAPRTEEATPAAATGAAPAAASASGLGRVPQGMTPVPARWGVLRPTPSRPPGSPPSRSGLCGGAWAAPRSSAHRGPSATAAASPGPGATG